MFDIKKEDSNWWDKANLRISASLFPAGYKTIDRHKDIMNRALPRLVACIDDMVDVPYTKKVNCYIPPETRIWLNKISDEITKKYHYSSFSLALNLGLSLSKYQMESNDIPFTINNLACYAELCPDKLDQRHITNLQEIVGVVIP